MPMQAQANNLQLNPIVDELKDLTDLETILISQLNPYMHIVAKHKGAQSGLKGQVTLVPADLKKIQSVLPRNTTDENLIAIALKRRLTDKSEIHRQNVRPAAIISALEKCCEINPLYKQVTLSNDWENNSANTDPELWKLLTEDVLDVNTENTTEDNDADNSETDSEDELNEVGPLGTKQGPTIHPTTFHPTHGPMFNS